MNFVFVVHVGHKIREVADESRVSARELALKINKSRTVVYNIFERKSVDSALLHKISKVLHHDFFQYYYQNEEHGAVKDGEPPYGKKDQVIASMHKELQSCRKELTELREKNQMLQKIIDLLEEKKTE